MSALAYSRVPSAEYDDVERENCVRSQNLDRHSSRVKPAQMSKRLFTAQPLIILNICIFLLLVVSAFSLKRYFNCVPGPPPPWSPVWNAGIVRNINTMYKPQKIFQSETSIEVEAAWENWLKEHDHLLILPTSDTKDYLPITVDAFLDPGYSVYGLAVYHQMHCLNHIRRSFYGDKFFPNISQSVVQFHKNHCFDMLRQAILCHGDVAMLHWWNDTYSHIDASGTVRLTDHYRTLTPSQRAEGAFAKWDTHVQCRDMKAINLWAKAHAMEDDKYIATVGQLRKR